MKGESMLWITVMEVYSNEPPLEYVQGFDMPRGMAIFVAATDRQK